MAAVVLDGSGVLPEALAEWGIGGEIEDVKSDLERVCVGLGSEQGDSLRDAIKGPAVAVEMPARHYPRRPERASPLP